MAKNLAEERWLSVKEVARAQGKRERTVRYELEIGRTPGVQGDGRTWCIPPAVLGQRSPPVVSEGIVIQILPGAATDEVQFLRHDLPGPSVYAYWQPASGTLGPVFVRPLSGQVGIQGLHSGGFGYVWLTQQGNAVAY